MHDGSRCLGSVPAQAAALRFQPTKRPQLASQKVKPKAPFAKPVAPSANSEAPDAGSRPAPAVAQPVHKTTLADWTADDDDVNGFYASTDKRQRGGRKKRKKNKEEEPVPQDWDDIYDPGRPNVYEEYKHSEEKIREIRDWKNRLYAHRMARRQNDTSTDDEQDHRIMKKCML